MKILYSNKSNHSFAAIKAIRINRMKALNLFRKKSDKTANRIIPVIIL